MPNSLTLPISFDREEDGRWIAEIEALPGCMVYATSRDQAARLVIALALNILADQLAQTEAEPAEPGDTLSWHVDFEERAA